MTAIRKFQKTHYFHLIQSLLTSKKIRLPQVAVDWQASPEVCSSPPHELLRCNIALSLVDETEKQFYTNEGKEEQNFWYKLSD